MSDNIFCLDTSAFIEAWHRHYPIDVPLFQPFWERLEEWGNEGRVLATEEVYREIEKTDDGLHDWLKKRKFFFRPLETDVQTELLNVQSQFPRLIDSKKNRSSADPWVIAEAIVSSAVVVTEEALRKNIGRSPKIPDVCDALAIPYTNTLGLIREMDIPLR